MIPPPVDLILDLETIALPVELDLETIVFPVDLDTKTQYRLRTCVQNSPEAHEEDKLCKNTCQGDKKKSIQGGAEKGNSKITVIGL